MTVEVTTANPERDRPKVVFISYSSADLPSVIALRDVVAMATGGEVEFFLAADDRSIPPGSSWPAQIEKNLRDASCVFIFLTHSALASQWVLFEAGFAHGRGVPVIPLGVLGVEVGLQIPPISHLQGIDVRGAGDLNHIVTLVAQHTGCRVATSLDDAAYQRVFAKARPQVRPVRVLRLPSRADIYTEGKRLIESCDIHAHVRATVSVFDPDDETDVHFRAYLEMLARKCGEAAAEGGSFTYEVVFGIKRNEHNAIPEAARKAIEFRSEVFRRAGVQREVRFYEIDEEWSLNMLFGNRDRAIIGFPADPDDRKLQNGLRLLGIDVVEPIVDWFDGCVKSRAKRISLPL